MDPLSLSRHYRCYPGQGDYPIVDISTRSRARAIAGRSRSRFSTSSSAAPRQRRSRSTACARCAPRREARRERGRRAAMRARRLPRRRRRRRRKRRIHRIRGRRREARRAVELFEGLGFRARRRTARRTVDLSPRATINLVVNRERKASPMRFALHGPSRLRAHAEVSTSSPSAHRARRAPSNAPSYVGRIGPGEARFRPSPASRAASSISSSRATAWRDDFSRDRSRRRRGAEARSIISPMSCAAANS